MGPASVTFQSNSKVPDQVKGPVRNVTSTKRKIEEQVKLPLASSHPQKIVRPRAPQQQPARMERPKKSQTNDQKYFPPGPQKVIRTPIHILKRKVFTPAPRSARDKKATSDSPIKELAKLQEVQGNSSSSVVSKNTSNTQEKPLGEVKPIIDSDSSQKKELPAVPEDKSDDTVSSDNLGLEEMVEGIQEIQPLQQNLQNQGENQNISRNSPDKITV